jgi:hypothetical protein
MSNENNAPTPSEDVRSLDPVALHALATCLLDYGDTGPPRLLVGAVSAQLPSEVTVPADAQVLGSLERDDGDVLVVCESEQGAGPLVVFYRAHLVTAGWYEPARPTQGGFMVGTSDGERHWLQFCKSRRGPSLEVSLRQRSEEPTRVRLTFRRDGRHGPCAYEERASPYPDHLLPNLPPPTGSRQVPGGGSASSDYASSDAQLDTTLDLAAVAEHYADQLVSAGWQLEGRGADPVLAWHTWRFTDSDGERWQGLFLARTRPTLPGEVLLHLRVDRLEGPPAGA